MGRKNSVSAAISRPSRSLAQAAVAGSIHAQVVLEQVLAGPLGHHDDGVAAGLEPVVDLLGHPEPIAVADRLDPQESPHLLDLFLERVRVRGALERSAQVVAELDTHVARGGWIRHRQGRDRVEAVEQKVRIDLRLQR